MKLSKIIKIAKDTAFEIITENKLKSYKMETSFQSNSKDNFGGLPTPNKDLTSSPLIKIIEVEEIINKLEEKNGKKTKG